LAVVASDSPLVCATRGLWIWLRLGCALRVCTADAWWVMLAVGVGEETFVVADAVPLVHTGVGLAPSEICRDVGLVVAM
jgi:hypothetical protein